MAQNNAIELPDLGAQGSGRFARDGGARLETGPPEPFLTESDLHWFNEGTHSKIYLKLGAHSCQRDGVDGVYFAVWAPRASSVSVLGEFNNWNGAKDVLRRRGNSGIWDGFVGGARHGAPYQYRINTPAGPLVKLDPVAFRQQPPSADASVVWDLEYAWRDQAWLVERGQRQGLRDPLSIYELHLGSWRRVPEEHNRSLTYRELAPWLTDYAQRLGFTHVGLLPVMEPGGDAAFAITSYFAPSARYGTPQDLMFLIDQLHQCGIGVILDWTPAHFPTDPRGLARFDGAPLYEQADPSRSNPLKPAFDFGRREVRSFLASSARFWLEQYHADALRIGAVGSLLYLADPTSCGDSTELPPKENRDAIRFLERLNASIYLEHPGAQTIAEESSGWPRVSRPADQGGLGFGYRWHLDWQRGALDYFSKDPIVRKFSHHEITARSRSGFSENFILPLSHDQVTRGRGALLSRFPGDEWQKFAQLRLLLGYQFGWPGKKLVFMGTEFGTWRDWNQETSLDWHLAEIPWHAGVARWVSNLNRVYRAERALHEGDAEAAGFSWVDANDADQSTLSWLRCALADRALILAVCNFTPVPRHNFRVGLPEGGYWREILNSDAKEFGGSGHGNLGGLEANPFPWHGRSHSLTLTLPPFGALFFKWEGT